MALKKLLADPFTRSELGRGGLEELSRNLWPGSCQSCGLGLGGDPPAVVVVDADVAVSATLHHRECQVPRWSRSGSVVTSRYVTIGAGLVFIPFGDPSRDPFLPAVIASPGLEQVSLACTESGRYRATTVDAYRPLGLRPASESLARSSSDEVTSWLTEQRLIVRCGRQFWVIPLDAAEREIAQEVMGRGGVVLGVSSAVDPTQIDDPEPLKRILAADDVALIFAPLCTTMPAPNIDRHAIMVESEFTHADESRDEDWLPVTPYPGPTYDPTTGLCQVGQGMDGPAHWRLHTPGVGVESGLIAGPAGTGRTNTLRVVIIEAIQSGVFCYAVIDPLDRNRLVDVFGKGAELAATTPELTMRVLEAFARIVDARSASPENYRDPSPQRPGFLLAIDDAHEALTDPRAVAIAAHIADAGPPAGVGLVVSTVSVNPADFAGRRDLILALSKTNTMIFDQAQLDLLRHLRQQS